ncbi:MAG: hypothetical protein HZB13_16795 [Acidobacteria bacterium]|nr:hypothetical protein [Acidobacteriota bacterium]
MSDWAYAQKDKSEELCRLHYFAVKKKQGERTIEFVITVREYVSPLDPTMPFFAQADREMNQNAVAYRPSGWGKSLLEALDMCLRAIRKFDYEGE